MRFVDRRRNRTKGLREFFCERRLALANVIVGLDQEAYVICDAFGRLSQCHR